MKKRIKRSLHIITHPETLQSESFLPLALITAIILSLINEFVIDLIKQLLEAQIGNTFIGIIGFVITLFITLIVILCIFSFLQDRKRIKQQKSIATQAKPSPHKGLILLVSREQACINAIQYHQPTLEHCWLLCSDQTLEIAQQIRTTYPHLCPTNPTLIHDIHDPLEYKTAVDQIYTQQLPPGWQETDIIADYTGMTAHASVGVALACLSTGRPLQYTPAIYSSTKSSDHPINSGTPMAITLTPPILHLPPAPPRRRRHRPKKAISVTHQSNHQ